MAQEQIHGQENSKSNGARQRETQDLWSLKTEEAESHLTLNLTS